MTTFAGTAAFVLFSSIVLFAPARCQNPGIRIQITAKGLNSIANMASPLLLQQINSMEPFSVPGFNKSIPLVGDVIIEQIGVSKINYTQILLNLYTPTPGIELTMVGVSASIELTGYIKTLFGKSDFDFSATVTETAFAIAFAITATAEGQPHVKVTSNVLDIGKISGVPYSWMNDLLTSYLDDKVPEEVTPQLDQGFDQFLGNLTMESFLDADNLTVIDYRLVEDPAFNDTSFVIDLKGDIHTTNTASCSTSPLPIAMSLEDNMQFYVSEALFECFLNAYSESGALGNLINGQLDSNLVLDGRVKLEIQPGNTSTINVNSDGITAILSLEVLLFKMFGVEQDFITLQVNVTATSGNVTLVNSPTGMNVTTSIVSAETELAVLSVASDMLPSVQQQIANANFTELSVQADELIASNILPTINAMLVNGVPIPTNLTSFLQDSHLYLRDDAVAFGTDVRLPPSL